MTQVATVHEADGPTDQSADGPTDQSADGPTDQSDAAVGEVLAAVRHSLLLVLDSLPAPPHRLRVHAADVEIELEWPRQEHAEALPGRLPGGAGQASAHAPAPASPAAPPPEHAGPMRYDVRAPSVGVFYRAPEPGAPPFVGEGDTVRPGQQVAIVEAMKLMLPVEADRAGRVVEVLKRDGEPVEYGEVLFVLAPDDGE